MAVISSGNIIPIGTPESSMYLASPINGQMNVPQSVVDVYTYANGGSSQSIYTIDGQMNVYQTPVTVSDQTLASQPLLPTYSNMQSNTVVSYTTMTNSVAGPVTFGIIKVFGESPQREYWL